MNRKATALCTSGVLVAAAVVGLSAATSAGASAPTITLTAVTTHESLLNLGAAADPTGNQFVSAHDLYRGGRKVGVDGASCQIIDVVQSGELRSQCVATVSLPKGQLTAQGLPTFEEAGTRPFTLAITGGTGAYAAAGGQVTVTPIDAQHARYEITLRK